MPTGVKPLFQKAQWKPFWRNADAYRNRAKLHEPLKRLTFLEASKAPSIPPPLPDKRQPAYVDLGYHMNVKEGDLVQVLYGRDSGKQGVIRKMIRKQNCVIVHGIFGFFFD